ncbi:MAG: SPFH domain-containing protein [Bacteroidales bacterium]
METQETNFKGLKINGFLMLGIVALLCVVVGFAISFQTVGSIIFAVTLLIAILILSVGFMMIDPNDMRVLVFFGKYNGTIKDNGFFWVNPFYSKMRLTARARNLDIEPIKVNDKMGNPVMIGLVLVWRVKDSYKAMFDIDSSASTDVNVGGGLKSLMASFQKFVSIQCDSALRNIASEYAYDNNEGKDEITLRSGGEEISEHLEKEINTRLVIAGIEVLEARINYLAYAPEIAAVMLRRQQASAIISAREKIVEGAVSMVRMALEKLSAENIVNLDEEKKAAMVSNLLVILCSDQQAQPVVNASTPNQ